jgi:D-alanine-D-alanine ligase
MKIAILQDVPDFSNNNASLTSCAHKEIASVISLALGKKGHSVESLHVTGQLECRLNDIKPEFVFNLASRQIGPDGLSCAPSIIEKMGIPFTGSSTRTCTLAYNKELAKQIFTEKNIPTPDFKFFSALDALTIPDKMIFPLFVKPVFGGCSRGIGKDNLIRSKENALNQIKNVIAAYPGSYLLEEFINGREFSVGFLGNDESCLRLPILEYIYPFGDESLRFRDYEMKEIHFREQKRVCPADLSKPFHDAIAEIAQRAFTALGCRDYARVDIRLDRSERPYLLEVNALPSLMPVRSSYVRMAAAAGLSSDKLVSEILRCAMDRYK